MAQQGVASSVETFSGKRRHDFLGYHANVDARVLAFESNGVVVFVFLDKAFDGNSYAAFGIVKG